MEEKTDEGGEAERPFAIFPAEEECQHKEAKEPAMNSSRPGDRFVMSGNSPANHGCDERKPRKSFDYGYRTKAID